MNLNEILNDWNRISGKLQNSDLKIKEKLSFFKMFKRSAVNSRSFRPRKIHEEIVKSSFICSKIGASSMDGKTASLLPKKQQKKRTKG